MIARNTGLPALSTRVGPPSLRQGDLACIDTGKLGVLNSLYSSGDFESAEYLWQWQRTRCTPVDHWVLLECGRERLWLGIVAAATDAEIDFCWRDFDSDAARIAWSASYPQLLEMTRQVFEKDWLPADIRSKFEPDESLFDAGFVIEAPNRRIATGRCLFGAGNLPATRPATAGPLAATVRQLPIAIPIVVDRATFAALELCKLEIGAVIRISRRAFLDIGAPLRLNVGGSDLLVKVTGTRLTVVDIGPRGSRAENNLENAMTSNEDQTVEQVAGNDKLATTPIDLAGMPVDIRFEAGRLQTRYDELCRIQPGYTYELGHVLGEHTIDITANGALIARGELVNLGDQLGVRITALSRVPGTAG